MRTKLSYRIAAVALACATVSCSSESNTLSGSMSEVYDLGFDSVAIVRQGDTVSVEYLRTSGPASSLGKTAKLVVNLSSLASVAGVTIDLTQLVGGSPRGALQRVQSVTTDYKLQRGTVVFDQAPDPGADVTGHFNTTLSEPAGRTLNGEFSATVTTP
jgi:hypothetical protein